MRDAQIARELEGLSGPAAERVVDVEESRRIAREAPFADSLPAYSGFFVSPAKTLWVADGMAPSDTAWDATAIRADGALIGRLHVRGKARPMAFGDDRVVLRFEDEDGVVSLRTYRLRPVAANG